MATLKIEARSLTPIAFVRSFNNKSEQKYTHFKRKTKDIVANLQEKQTKRLSSIDMMLMLIMMD